MSGMIGPSPVPTRRRRSSFTPAIVTANTPIDRGAAHQHITASGAQPSTSRQFREQGSRDDFAPFGS
jgi:hypothetical protein